MSFDWNLQTGDLFMKGHVNYEIKHKPGKRDLSFLVEGHAINYWIFFSSSKPKASVKEAKISKRNLSRYSRFQEGKLQPLTPS